MSSQWQNLRIKATQPFILARGLKEFFREPVSLKRAEGGIQNALASREERFLELVRTQIYGWPANPYLKLLRFAGCAFSDLEALVREHGLEPSLGKLAREGVYFTADEFKGKKEAVRGRQSFQVSPKDFDSPTPTVGFISQSSGTTNRPVPAIVSLDRLALQALGSAVSFHAHNLLAADHAVYDAVLPGSGGVSYLLGLAKLGIRTDRWFARKVPVNIWLQRQYHYAVTALIVLMGKCFGPGFPRPELIAAENVDPIVRWVAARKGEGQTRCVRVSASNGVRIARRASEMGISLEGAKLIVGGEPLTDSKREVIARVGAAAIPQYSSAEGGIMANGCAYPAYTDEMHVNQYMHAVISRPGGLTEDSAIHPLLWTTVHPFAARLHLNVENGDYATLEKRDCGCALEKVGFTLHLHGLRSYEKFTTEGMNYFYGNLFQLLESTLPSEFGGDPGDYQLVEEEDSAGQTRITLRIDPQVGEVEEQRVLSRLRQELAQGSPANAFQARIWEDAGTLRVKREKPYATPRGKILPLQIRR